MGKMATGKSFLRQILLSVFLLQTVLVVFEGAAGEPMPRARAPYHMWYPSSVDKEQAFHATDEFLTTCRDSWTPCGLLGLDTKGKPIGERGLLKKRWDSSSLLPSFMTMLAASGPWDNVTVNSATPKFDQFPS